MATEDHDRISEILQWHLDAARKQFDYYQMGARLEDNVLGIPRTEQELLMRIDNLEAALARHQERRARRSPS